MNIKFIIVIIIISALFSCENQIKESNDFSFYHWKSNAEYPKAFDNALSDLNTQKIYLHYFDVDKLKEEPKWINNGIYPTYVLKKVDKKFRDYKIIPTVFITNQVFKTKELDLKKLAKQITTLIHQISETHFKTKLHSIQIDSDWTQTTKNNYFELLNLLKKDFEIDVTLRLHQIKYKEKTGVPPVQKGTLMLYNVGDLKDKNQNSILENKIVQTYIGKNTDYPIPMNVALPLFSQTVISNKKNDIKLLNKDYSDVFSSQTKYFKKLNENNFEVIKDTLFKGFYLNEGYYLKIETSNEKEILDSYKTIKDSDLELKNVIFYHLDEEILSKFNLKKLTNKL